MISKAVAAFLIFGPWSPSLAAAQEFVQEPINPRSNTSEMTYEFFVVEQRAADFLGFLARHTNTRFDLSERVVGLIRKKHYSGDVDDIVYDIADQFDLDMFEFNGVRYLSKKDEALTRMVRVGALDADDIRIALTDIGMDFDKFPVSDAADGTAVVISAPPKLLAISEVIIENLPQKIATQSLIRVRRGGYLNHEQLPTRSDDDSADKEEN